MLLLKLGFRRWTTHPKTCRCVNVFFLLEASKKADQAFSVAPQTTAHTIVDSQKDVTLMSKCLIESAITSLDTEANTSICRSGNYGLEEIDNHNLAPRHHS